MTLRNHTMRDLLSKLDAIVSETALRDKEDLQAKRKALQDLQMDPNSKDPEIKQAIIQRKANLEREAKAKGFTESTDHEASMAKAELLQIAKNAKILFNRIQEGDELPGWVSSYITLANDHLNSAAENIEYDPPEQQ
jgi:hypothetical protein